MLVWRRAITLPTVIGRADSTHTSGPYTSPGVGKAMKITAIRAKNPAAFADTDRKAVTGVGAPSYVSGAQVWNGTADTLNANPATMNATATTSSPIRLRSARSAPMSTSLVEPVAPYSRLIP